MPNKAKAVEQEQAPNLATSPNEHSVDSAARSLFDSLASDPDFAEDETTESVDESQAETDESQEELVEAESEDFEEDVEDEGEVEDEEYDEAEEDEEPELYTVKVDGEEVEVTFDELLSGYSRTQDYTRKTQNLAEQRKEIESTRSEVEQARDRYLAGLQQLEQALSPDEPDWDKLREDLSPDQFAARWADHQRQVQDLQKLQQHRVQEQREREQEILSREQEALVEAVPEWKDDEVKQEELGELHSYAKNLGYTDEELSQVYDHRVLLMLRDAKRYRDLKAKGTEATKGKKKTSKTLKPGARKKTSPKAKSRKKAERAMERLERSGRPEDAAAVFLETLDLDE